MTSYDTDIYSFNKNLFDRNKKVIDSSYTTDRLVQFSRNPEYFSPRQNDY